jgi:hypothetical protein
MLRLPARLDAAQTAALLGFQLHDIPVLVAAKLLQPLGRPAPNSTKYFAAVDVQEWCRDRKLLDNCTKAIGRRWQEKNSAMAKVNGRAS